MRFLFSFMSFEMLHVGPLTSEGNINYTIRMNQSNWDLKTEAAIMHNKATANCWHTVLLWIRATVTATEMLNTFFSLSREYFEPKRTRSSPIRFVKRLHPNAKSPQPLLWGRGTNGWRTCQLELRDVNEQCEQINSPQRPRGRQRVRHGDAALVVGGHCTHIQAHTHTHRLTTGRGFVCSSVPYLPFLQESL